VCVLFTRNDNSVKRTGRKTTLKTLGMSLFYVPLRDSAYILTASRNIKIELTNIQRNYIELRTYLMFTYILILYTEYIRRYTKMCACVSGITFIRYAQSQIFERQTY
jgi:hypothetical protein